MLDHDLIQRTLSAALRTGGELAEVFVEDKASSNAIFDDGKVEHLTSGRDRGAGIRVIVGDTTGFAHTADLSEQGLAEAAEAAAAAARSGGGGVKEVALTRQQAPRPNEVAVLPEDVAKARKVELLRRADEAARGAGSSITQVTARYGDSRRRILVANSDGLLTEDDQVRTLFSVMAVASGDTGMQTGYQSLGRTVGFELFDRFDVEDLGREAAERALLKLAARPAPSGTMPVVIGPGGVFTLDAKNVDHIDAFDRFLSHDRDARIVWAHGGSDFTGNMTPSLIGSLMDRHPNLFMSLRPLPPQAARNPFGLRIYNLMLTGGQLDSAWLALLRKHADRFVMGGDAFFLSASVRMAARLLGSGGGGIWTG